MDKKPGIGHYFQYSPHIFCHILQKKRIQHESFDAKHPAITYRHH